MVSVRMIDSLRAPGTHVLGAFYFRLLFLCEGSPRPC